MKSGSSSSVLSSFQVVFAAIILGGALGLLSAVVSALFFNYPTEYTEGGEKKRHTCFPRQIRSHEETCLKRLRVLRRSPPEAGSRDRQPQKCPLTLPAEEDTFSADESGVRCSIHGYSIQFDSNDSLKNIPSPDDLKERIATLSQLYVDNCSRCENNQKFSKVALTSGLGFAVLLWLALSLRGHSSSSDSSLEIDSSE